MLKKILTIGLLVAISQSAYAFSIGNLIETGSDAVKVVTLSDSDVKKLASDASKQSDKLNRVAPSASPYAKRLAKLTKGMKTADGLELDIKVYLVKDVNAFAMANGTIRIFAGLMEKMTDDEVRYVIGHEIGHVNLGHSKKALQTAYATSTVRKAGAASGNALVTLSDSALGDLTEKLVNAQFSQSQENEADQYALKFMKTNAYEPKAAVSALRKLEKMFGNNKSMLSSHPAPGDRADALEKEI